MLFKVFLTLGSESRKGRKSIPSDSTRYCPCRRQPSSGPCFLSTISPVGTEAERGPVSEPGNSPRSCRALCPLTPHWIPCTHSPLCTLAHAVLHLECPSILPAPQECMLIFQGPAQVDSDGSLAELPQQAPLSTVLPQQFLKAWVTACTYHVVIIFYMFGSLHCL